MPKSNNDFTPSLLEPQSCGGDIAKAGFTFQDNILLAKLPSWLAQESFTEFISEAMGDFEVNYFNPRQGMEKELFEVKNHSLDSTKFWDEIKRFYNLQLGSSETYRHFFLITTGVTKQIKPLLNKLKRFREPENFYDDSSPIWKNSYNSYLKTVQELGKNENLAKFILEKVSVETNWSEAKTFDYPLFLSSLGKYFKSLEDEVPSKKLKNIFEQLLLLVGNRQNKPIKRIEIENIFRDNLVAEMNPTKLPIKLLTRSDNLVLKATALQFEWIQFFGGAKRIYPLAEEWENLLMKDLYRTRDWIFNHRSTRRIRLQGSRRLSACIAIGSVFSAVAGFSIEVEFRDQIWATDAHSTVETPDYDIQEKSIEGEGDEIIISINIIRDISSHVETCLPEFGLENIPVLHIKGYQPIISPEQTNLIVQKIKNLISDRVSVNKSKVIHLFLATPAPLAIFLGHRLNATASVQCYEWIKANQYTLTCRVIK